MIVFRNIIQCCWFKQSSDLFILFSPDTVWMILSLALKNVKGLKGYWETFYYHLKVNILRTITVAVTEFSLKSMRVYTQSTSNIMQILKENLWGLACYYFTVLWDTIYKVEKVKSIFHFELTSIGKCLNLWFV